MSSEDKETTELRCVERYFRNRQESPEVWQAQKNPIESDVVDVKATHKETKKTMLFQVTQWHRQKVDHNLQSFIDLTQSDIEAKVKHYGGVKNTTDIILLLDSYEDLPAQFNGALEVELAKRSFEGFKEIYIVCPHSNIKVK